MKKKRKVIIHVTGGVAYIQSKPRDIDVEIIDFDNREECEDEYSSAHSDKYNICPRELHGSFIGNID